MKTFDKAMENKMIGVSPSRKKCELEFYFTHTRGFGVLSTADGVGEISTAVYARPHVLDTDLVAFFMADRRSHANLKTNPKAAYLFKEKGDQYQGKRLFLTKIREESEDESELRSRRRKCYDEMGLDQGSGSFVVYFRVDKVVPLVGIG